jgi:hypothetical protein
MISSARDNFHPDRYSQIFAHRAEHCPFEMQPFSGVLTASRLQNRYRYRYRYRYAGAFFGSVRQSKL